MSDLTRLTLTQAREGLLKKEFSSHELTQAFLDRMDDSRNLNAYITETPDLAVAQAKESDIRFAQKDTRLLEGLPLGIKDLFCTKGIRTTAGSKMLENFVPPYESTVTQNLWNQGAVCLGKTNMDEFAMGSANTNSFFGPAINPWKSSKNPDLKLVPGGSSGGSAAAVAARLCLAATASDTGGSIRQPASFCGLVGIKPTYGLCSRWGMVAFASSLDQAGPVTHTVADSALMISVMASYDEKDATSAAVTVPKYLDNLLPDVQGLRIGVPQEYQEGLSEEMNALFMQGVHWLTAAGAQVKEIQLPTSPHALPTYYIIAPAEASSNLARYDGVRYGYRTPNPANLTELYEKTRGEGFGTEVKRRLMIGTYVLSAGHYDAYYVRALKIAQMIKNDFAKAFEDVDLILTPTTLGGAFALGEKVTDPISMYMNDLFTVTVNLAGLPAISVPCGLSHEGLPLGLQLIAPAFEEQRLLNGALVLEESRGEAFKTFACKV